MLLEGIDRLSLERHDFGGSAHALLAGFIRRIDRLKAHLVGAEDYARWAARLGQPSEAGAGDADLEQEFAEVYRVHEQLLAETGARDAGDLIRDAAAGGRRIGPLPRAGSSTCWSTTRTTSTSPRRRWHGPWRGVG